MIRRFLTRLLMIVLLAVCGYNWLQVRRLQAEVGALQARLAVKPHSPPLAESLPTAQELRRGARGLTEALDSAGSPQSQRRLRELQAQTEQLRKQADALWRESHSLMRY